MARLVSRCAERNDPSGVRRGVLPALAALLLCVHAVSAQAVHAQPLALKRTLSPGAAPGCALAPILAPGLRRDNAEARRLSAAGQEAALIGERVTARESFAKAAALNPADERIAYDLGRAHEELGETLPAIGEYCRYLALSPGGREGADVRARLTRLTPPSAAADAQRAAASFQLGVAHFDARRWDAAATAFGDAVQRGPAATEALFDRALSYASANRRADAVKDFELYLVRAPSATDRAAVVRAIDALRRPVYSASSALARGIIPGLGQVYTGRPGRGIAVLALVAGAGISAAYQRTDNEVVPYVDPNGVPVPYTITTRSRPYLAAGMAAGVGLTIAAALEAAHFAKRSNAAGARVGPYVGSRGEMGVSVARSF